MFARIFQRPLFNVLLYEKLPVRLTQASTNVAVPESRAAQLQNLKEEKERLLAEMQKDLPKPYDGPERDLVNFPRFPRPIYPGKVRMGFAPERWFEFFYKKTGVTGPYVFGGGLLTFLLSKEWYVIEEELSTGMALFTVIYIIIKKLGPTVRAWAEKVDEDHLQKLENMKADGMKSCHDNIALEKKKQWQAGIREMLIQAKKENVQIQLEAEYRNRMMTVYQQVKKRLDYFMDMDNTRRKLEQKHMVEWIVSNVMKSITPQQEKEALEKCVQDLKVLSARSV